MNWNYLKKLGIIVWACISLFFAGNMMTGMVLIEGTCCVGDICSAYHDCIAYENNNSSVLSEIFFTFLILASLISVSLLYVAIPYKHGDTL